MNPIRYILPIFIVALFPLPALTANVTPTQKLESPASKTIGASKLTPRPAGPPYNVMLPEFTVTGTGTAEARAAFAPIHITLSEFTVTGTGATDARAVFSPISVTLPEFTVTGTSE